MVTHVDYIKHRGDCISKTRQSTSKEKIIVLSDQMMNEIPGYSKSEFIYVPFGKFNELTVKMAQTFGDLAGVIIVPGLYENTIYSSDLRRIRQLTNAEGAMMIWDDLDAKPQADLSKLRTQIVPDIYLDSDKIYEINSYETEFVRSEIFDNKTYLKHGITLPPNAIVIDIGANIGLFTRFVKEHSPNSVIYAFEPSKEVFEILKKNTHSFGKSVTCFNMGVSHRSGVENFTYYPGYSVISGFHTNLEMDKSVILAGEKFKQQPATDETINARFGQEKSYPCHLLSLSEIIETNNIDRIDFLKIDAEKSELQIIKGLTQENLKIISQIVMEIHGEEKLLEIKNILTSNGFITTTETAIIVSGAVIYTLYGKKDDRSF